jgi:site-specific recombinase XerD
VPGCGRPHPAGGRSVGPSHLGKYATARDNWTTYAANTVRAYRADWRDFSSWALDRQLRPLPAAPGTLALYLAHLGRLAKAPSTISRRLVAIAEAHREAGLPSPTEDRAVKAIWARVRQRHGVSPRETTPLTAEVLDRVVQALPADVSGMRDRALLLVGFAGALRRSELVGLDAGDVEETDEGLVLRVRRSSSEGKRRTVFVPYGSEPETCPVRALRDWMKRAGIETGPVFRAVSRTGKVASDRLSPAGANRAVQRAVGRAGLDPKAYCARSLRVGGSAPATWASRSGSRGLGWW